MRTGGERGACGAGDSIELASATIHRGEEPPISGTRGSATFFFSHCPLSCLFCQNYPISQMGHGASQSIEAVARRMLALARRGAHNINLVTGTQFAAHLVEAVRLARRRGLLIPVVWNTSGYETERTIQLLAGTVDIYLTDIKYADNGTAEFFSGAPGYFETATAAAEQMLRQVGPLEVDHNGIGVRGVLIRHLVLPEGRAGTGEVMAYIAETLGPNVPISLMGQYFPAHLAFDHPPLNRRVNREEYEEAKAIVRRAGIEKGWFQILE